jgi:hypothetical protein
MSQTINTVKVRVNSTSAVKVQSIQYSPQGNYTLRDAADITISDNLTGRGVLTYNENTQQFVVQDLPTLNGGTF